MSEFNNDNNKNPFESGSGRWEHLPQSTHTDGNPQTNTPDPFNSYSQPVTPTPAGGNNDPYNSYTQPTTPSMPNGGNNGGSDNPFVKQYFDEKSGGDGSKKKSSGMALASMILGIVALVLGSCCCCCSPIISLIVTGIVGTVGLVLGIITLVKQGKDGKAIAGVVMCGIAILIAIVNLALSLAFTEEINRFMEEFYNEYPEFNPGDNTFGDGNGDI